MLGGGRAAQPRVGRRAGHGDQRVAGRRVARPRAAAARRRSTSPTRTARSRPRRSTAPRPTRASSRFCCSIRTAEPLGRRKYWPMYEAAVEHDLPVGIHFGGWGGGPITGAGFASFYIEDTVGMATAFQEQVTSLVCEGVFERFPTLRIVLIEGGFALAAAAHVAAGPRVEPAAGRGPAPRRGRRRSTSASTSGSRPSRSRSRRGARTSPVMLDQLGMDDRVMFATDYPHWDFDSPAGAIPSFLDGDLRRAIMHENAQGARTGSMAEPATRARRRATSRRSRRRSRKIVDVAGRSIGVFNVGGRVLRAAQPLPAPGRPALRGVRHRARCARAAPATTTTGPAKDRALPVARLGVRHRAPGSRGSTRSARGCAATA